ncbi:hypothetical protein BD626DRAFT_501329 [Schizophyllum amplum]|uniref:Secreted protein n=1 Tax=Schizophyllum amplum TaxID=97359 RepID=A0A550C9S6_9AGAR|nr:hypothetical protein BD626DRAFT_501329 [Auriculariopsis ampla]
MRRPLGPLAAMAMLGVVTGVYIFQPAATQAALNSETDHQRNYNSPDWQKRAKADAASTNAPASENAQTTTPQSN